MTRNPSSRDWELLSAYLDGELDGRRRAQIETRLQKEPSLGRAYQRIRRNRALLRRSPLASAPRSFALTPQMVAQSTGLFGGFFSPAAFSAFASLLLVVVLAVDLLLTGSPIALLNEPGAQPAADQVAETLPPMEAVEESIAAESVEDSADRGADADTFAYDDDSGDAAADESRLSNDSVEGEQLQPADELAMKESPQFQPVDYLALVEFLLAALAVWGALYARRQRANYRA